MQVLSTTFKLLTPNSRFGFGEKKGDTSFGVQDDSGSESFESPGGTVSDRFIPMSRIVTEDPPLTIKGNGVGTGGMVTLTLDAAPHLNGMGSPFHQVLCRLHGSPSEPLEAFSSETDSVVDRYSTHIMEAASQYYRNIDAAFQEPDEGKRLTKLDTALAPFDSHVLYERYNGEGLEPYKVVGKINLARFYLNHRGGEGGPLIGYHRIDNTQLVHRNNPLGTEGIHVKMPDTFAHYPAIYTKGVFKRGVKPDGDGSGDHKVLGVGDQAKPTKAAPPPIPFEDLIVFKPVYERGRKIDDVKGFDIIYRQSWTGTKI